MYHMKDCTPALKNKTNNFMRGCEILMVDITKRLLYALKNPDEQ